jgi:hypothetical protein
MPSRTNLLAIASLPWSKCWVGGPQHPSICSRFTSICEISNAQSITLTSGKPCPSWDFFVKVPTNNLSRLDVSQHMSLCRHYVRELRRSVLVETPDLEKSGSKRSSAVLDNIGDMNELAGPSTGMNGEEKSQDQRLSAFLRSENGKPGPAHSPHSSTGSHLSTRPSGDRPPRPSFMSTPEHGTDSNSPGQQVARNDIRQSAEKILYTFLLPGSEREIILPDHMLRAIIAAIEEEGRDDPEVFDEGKDYVFQAMERDAFPGFLQAKAFGNLVPPSIFLRLILGLACIAAGLWSAFVLVFRHYPRHTRCWVSSWA